MKSPEQTSGDHSEAEALLRIANVIAAELPSITAPHWYDVLAKLQMRLGDAAARRATRARLERVEGGG